MIARFCWLLFYLNNVFAAVGEIFSRRIGRRRSRMKNSRIKINSITTQASFVFLSPSLYAQIRSKVVSPIFNLRNMLIGHWSVLLILFNFFTEFNRLFLSFMSNLWLSILKLDFGFISSFEIAFQFFNRVKIH